MAIRHGFDMVAQRWGVLNDLLQEGLKSGGRKPDDPPSAGTHPRSFDIPAAHFGSLPLGKANSKFSTTKRLTYSSDRAKPNRPPASVHGPSFPVTSPPPVLPDLRQPQ